MFTCLTDALMTKQDLVDKSAWSSTTNSYSYSYNGYNICNGYNGYNIISPNYSQPPSPVPLPASALQLTREPNHFRPVALTSHLMKTMERLILNHLCPLVSSTLDHLQFTYQPGTGVDDSLIYLLHRSLPRLEPVGSTVGVMFFDFSSAFNTIQPSLLRGKLEGAEVDCHLTAWIIDYLTNRPHYNDYNIYHGHSGYSSYNICNNYNGYNCYHGYSYTATSRTINCHFYADITNK
ncbi:hypothetical protein LDENG_00022000 [Lucifuga dentata]|nr:hypothetical protein LDENG_00022000 [Lucifuga dentata]